VLVRRRWLVCALVMRRPRRALAGDALRADELREAAALREASTRRGPRGMAPPGHVVGRGSSRGVRFTGLGRAISGTARASGGSHFELRPQGTADRLRAGSPGPVVGLLPVSVYRTWTGHVAASPNLVTTVPT